MRIRSIKPEFWRSEDIAKLDWHDRLLFIGLWSYVDDNGVGRDVPAIITADLFALDGGLSESSLRVQAGLNRLHTAGLIDRYTARGKPYLHIKTWDRHQKINRPSPGRYPLPNGDSVEIHEPLTESSVSPHSILSAGTGEQGNRGTGEQISLSAIANATEDGRADVDALCEHLADRITANGNKPPVISQKWKQQARLMLDADKRSQDEAHRLIDWCQSDTFWMSNILSMPKLREKYDQIRLRAGAAVAPVYTPDGGYTDPDWQDDPRPKADPYAGEDLDNWSPESA